MGVAACKSEVSKAGREIAEHGTEQFPAACYRILVWVVPVCWPLQVN